ncbi:MAG: branched-chain amino acid transporter permease [Acutalibacteraceae bacterium]
MNDKQVFISIVIMSSVTIALRFLPFILFSGKKTPKVISYLGKVLPYAMMGMLVVYCLRDISFNSAGGFVPEILASAVVVVSYMIKKNSLISIISGTVSYMLLVQLVFV